LEQLSLNQSQLKLELQTILTAADEMHDLDPIAVIQYRIGPFVACNDRPVEFDSDTLTRQGKKIEQPVKRDLAVDPFRFPVQRNIH
jgi:chaperonin cofactor prefoldin